MSGWRSLRRFRRRPRARIGINVEPRSTPYGGGNQFVLLLAAHLRDLDYEVRYRLDDDLDAVLLVDGRPALTTFGADDVAALKRRRPSLVCIHRVNECDLRKGTTDMDALLARTNTVADHTVFISAWLRDYHAERWFDRARPHTVIVNGSDPRIFHPVGPRAPDHPFRIATHHWSDHPMKGFAEYAEIDRLIAEGILPDSELWVIGRWPADIRWRAARLFPPRTGPELAGLLRQCHAYVTASRWEPGGMHFIEAAQCGLPVLYHEDGGGIVELAARFGVVFRDDVGAGVARLRAEYVRLRGQALTAGPSGDLMCLEYRRVLEALLVLRGASA
jgi:glycosyltransferase involved in cell wall biosynthesis